MIFAPEQVRRIKAGKMTQDRRRLRDFRPPKHLPKCVPVHISAQKPPACHITILEVRESDLESLTLKDARKMGYRTTIDFWDDWHGRYAINHDCEPVWLITFELGDTTDEPRLLKARPGGSQYTSIPSKALHGSAEEVSAHTQGKYVDEAQEGVSVARSARYEQEAARLQSYARQFVLMRNEKPYMIAESLRGLERQCLAIARKIRSEGV